MVYSWFVKPMIAIPLCVFDPTQCLKGASVLAISFAEHSCNTTMSGCKLITISRFFSNPILQFQETIRIIPQLEFLKKSDLNHNEIIPKQRVWPVLFLCLPTFASQVYHPTLLLWRN